MKKVFMADDSDLKACEPGRGLKNEEPNQVVVKNSSENHTILESDIAGHNDEFLSPAVISNINSYFCFLIVG